MKRKHTESDETKEISLLEIEKKIWGDFLVCEKHLQRWYEFFEELESYLCVDSQEVFSQQIRSKFEPKNSSHLARLYSFFSDYTQAALPTEAECALFRAIQEENLETFKRAFDQIIEEQKFTLGKLLNLRNPLTNRTLMAVVFNKRLQPFLDFLFQYFLSDSRLSVLQLLFVGTIFNQTQFVLQNLKIYGESITSNLDLEYAMVLARLLILATCNSSFELARQLLERGANPDTLNQLKYSAFGVAVKNGNESLVHLFVKHKGDVNQYVEKEGKFLLGVAASEKYANILRYLLKHGGKFLDFSDEGNVKLKNVFVEMSDQDLCSVVEKIDRVFFPSFVNAIDRILKSSEQKKIKTHIMQELWRLEKTLESPLRVSQEEGVCLSIF